MERNITQSSTTFCDGNNQKNDKMMNDKDRQDYFVSLINWMKNNYEGETRKEVILKQVPAKKDRPQAHPILQ